MTNQITAKILIQETIIREFLKSNLSLASIHYLALFARWDDLYTSNSFTRISTDDVINGIYDKCHDYIWYCVKTVTNNNHNQSFLSTLSQWDNGLVDSEITFKRFMVILAITYTALLMTDKRQIDSIG